MNAVEIEAAVSELAAGPFDPAEFAFRFLAAFDKKETTLKRLRKGDSNKSDVPSGVLLQANIHIAVCQPGETRATLELLKASPRTAAGKAKFVLATDGVVLEAEDLLSGESIAPDYPRFAEHIGFFLPLAGISTVREIKDNPIDVRATGRLNKLYVELLRQNPEWGTDARRHDMNHFMARLIFCFFAEDTDIFNGSKLFSDTVTRFSDGDGSNTHIVIEACFRAMNTRAEQRETSRLPNYTVSFPYVNGGLFGDATDVPQFTRIARSYLLQAGALDWQHINPDIFGSMIQAVADETERGELGMHYTSVPNILKVLKPLFLDELCAALDAAGDNGRTLLNLRKRISRMRVFDPACGSGNFLVIAYKELRKIEAEINRRRGEELRPSEISEKNFRGIELRDFAAEIARLSLVISKFQADVLHRGPLVARAEFLPLKDENWIARGNALRLDWLKVCPPEGTGVRLVEDDLFQTPMEQSAIDFENEGGETFICGNPPYKGSKWQTEEQKEDLKEAWREHPSLAKVMDYVSGWFAKFLTYAAHVDNASAAFVSTNSICQGQQASDLWPLTFSLGFEISFARTSFQWKNLAANNAGVTVVVIGVSRSSKRRKTIFHDDVARSCESIGPYLVPNMLEAVQKSDSPIGGQASMVFGNMPRDGGNLFLSYAEALELRRDKRTECFVKPFIGAEELINGTERLCLWIEDRDVDQARSSPLIAEKLNRVAASRRESKAASTRAYAEKPYRFVQIAGRPRSYSLVVASVSSENREYLPIGLFDHQTICSNKTFAIFDAPLWNMALIASRLHWVWVGTVCVRMRTDFSYSNTLGWNTFPMPPLTEQNKVDLTQTAENILLAREMHYPATIADLYDPEAMPANLRAAHDANDEILERIYIGRRFRNDTERLEKLFELYAKMTDKHAAVSKGQERAKKLRTKAKTAAKVQA